MTAIMPDEKHPLAINILRNARDGFVELAAPSFLYIEANNVLLTAFRKKRIDQNAWLAYVNQLQLLPFHADTISNEAVMQNKLALLASENGLSLYDALYLELAIRRNIPLATLDKTLSQAAKKHGLLYQPSGGVNEFVKQLTRHTADVK